MQSQCNTIYCSRYQLIHSFLSFFSYSSNIFASFKYPATLPSIHLSVASLLKGDWTIIMVHLKRENSWSTGCRVISCADEKHAHWKRTRVEITGKNKKQWCVEWSVGYTWHARITHIPALRILLFFHLIRVLTSPQTELRLLPKVQDPSKSMPNTWCKFWVDWSSHSRLTKYVRILKVWFWLFFLAFWALPLSQIEVAPQLEF